MELRYTYVDCHDMDHVGFLYLLLSTRQLVENISHIDMPDFSNHVEFVRNTNYKIWNIVELVHETYCYKIGAFYVTQKNEIGIHLLPQFQNRSYGTQVLTHILKRIDTTLVGPFYANINPANAKSIALFEKAGFKHIQNTYRLD